jgi:hypothetical protein|tara:strand:- start:4689 stop:5201 length:513 start_codon:yes stop_codon:yes gene_type:complete
MAAPGTFIANFTHGQITVSDGSSTPLSLTLTLDEGSMSISGMADKLREVAAYETRGALRGLALTTRSYPSGSFSSLINEWSDTSTGTLLDMITGQAGSAFAARESTLGATHPVICLDVAFQFTDYAGTAHDIKLHDCYLVAEFAEGDPSTLSFSFTCYGEIDGDLSMDES